MSESKIEIGKKTVNPKVFRKSVGAYNPGPFIAERRAYAIFRATGKGVCGAGTQQVESTEVSTSNYESILSGTRQIPPPSLTSVDWSTDAANDIIDAYLWKATVSFTCYSPEDFANLDSSFFRHLNEVALTLGWINFGEPVTIYGNIVDYQFSINEKLHYDCSVTFAGAHIQSAAAFNTAAKQPGGALLKFGQNSNNTEGFSIQPQSIVGILRAQAEQELGVTIPGNEANETAQATNPATSTSGTGLGNAAAQAKPTTTSTGTTSTGTTSTGTTSTGTAVTTTKQKEGEETGEGGGYATGNNHFCKATITVPDSSWVTYIPFVDDVQEKEFFYVSFGKLIQTINENITNSSSDFEGFFYFIPPDSIKDKLNHNLCKSANPTALINGWSAEYSKKLNLYPGGKDFYICFSELERIEEEIRRDKSDTPHLTKKSILHFFKKVCGIINENLGNAVQMEVIPYNQFVTDDKKKKYGYEITDRKTVIKPTVPHTVANPLDLGSLIRSISVQSTTDSEMAAIALSAAQGGGEGSSTIIKGGLFGCSDKKSSEPAVGTNSVLKSAQSQADASYGAKPGETKGQGTAVAGIPKYLAASSGTESTSNYISYGAVTSTALKIEPVKTVESQQTPEDQLTGMFEAYSVFDSAVVSDTLVVMKKIWGTNPGKINGYSYGVTVTVTVDGYAENLFGQTFKVKGLPSMLNNAYFVVLKQGHKFSNGDWTMDLEGQMMFDFNGKTAKNPPIGEGIDYVPGGNTSNVQGKPGDFTTSPTGAQIRTPCGIAGVNSPFSKNRWGRVHYGYDYNCPQGTPLYSPFKCKVVVAASAASACGGMVSLHCYDDNGSPNYALVQCHLQDVYVKAGDMINRGKMYGRSGGGQSGPSRGRSGGPHLHLEIYKAPFDGFGTMAGSGRGSGNKLNYVVTDHSLMNGWDFGFGAPSTAAANPPVTAANTAPNLNFVQTGPRR